MNLRPQDENLHKSFPLGNSNLVPNEFREKRRQRPKRQGAGASGLWMVVEGLGMISIRRQRLEQHWALFLPCSCQRGESWGHQDGQKQQQ